MRQLGEIRRRDPELYVYMESAMSEKNRRINEDLEKARNQ